MTIVRWLLFIPAAFVVAVIVGALMNFVSQIFFPEWISWCISGAFSGAGFMLTGFKVAPRITRTVKWILILIVGVIGLMSAIGSLIGENKTAVLAGAIMVVIAVSFIGKSIDEISADV